MESGRAAKSLLVSVAKKKKINKNSDNVEVKAFSQVCSNMSRASKIRSPYKGLVVDRLSITLAEATKKKSGRVCTAIEPSHLQYGPKDQSKGRR